MEKKMAELLGRKPAGCCTIVEKWLIISGYKPMINHPERKVPEADTSHAVQSSMAFAITPLSVS